MLIKNANIVKEKNNLKKVDILVEDGKIKKIEEPNKISSMFFIDASNFLVLPGFVDAHVHFDDPGFTEREDFATGTMSAAKGGVTTIIDMPCTSIPPVIVKENLRYKLDIVSKKAYVDFAFWGGITPEQIWNKSYKKVIRDLKDEGVVGLKLYTISGMETYPRLNLEEMAQVFETISDLGLVAAIHSEDFDLVDYFTKKLMGEGNIAPLAWTKGRNYEAEAVSILRSVALAKEFKNKVHIVHLSTKLGLKVVEYAKSEGVNITAETCPQYLIFTEEDLEKIGPILKTAPPVRKKEDCDYLFEGLKCGSVDFVTTDHAGGVYPEEKSKESIWDNYAGIPGVQTRFNALFTYGYCQGKLTLDDLVRVLSTKPAERFGLTSKGKIEEGFDADLVFVDPISEFIFNSSKELLSKNKYSPFDGVLLKGKIIKTMLRGEIVYDSRVGVTGKAGYGKFIKSAY